MQEALSAAESSSSARVSKLESELIAATARVEELLKLHQTEADVAAKRVQELELEAAGSADELKKSAAACFEKTEECTRLEQERVVGDEELNRRIASLEGDLVALSSGADGALVEARADLAKAMDDFNASSR